MFHVLTKGLTFLQNAVLLTLSCITSVMSSSP